MLGIPGLGCKDRETSTEGYLQLDRESEGSLGYEEKKQTTKSSECKGGLRKLS